MEPHIIVTDRLRLEPARVEHAELVFKQFSDERLWTFFPELRPTTIEQMRALYRRWERPLQRDELLENWICFLRDTKTPIANMQASIMANGNALMAFILYADYHGQGFAKEILSAVIEHVREMHAVKKVIMEMDPEHRSAIRLAESLGFTLVEQRKGVDRRYGFFGDENVYELSI